MTQYTNELCEHTKIRLIAAAIGHQQCTKTGGTEVLIPGTNKRILVGDDAYLAKVAAPACDVAATLASQSQAAQPTTGDAAELVERMRDQADCVSKMTGSLLLDAAMMIEQLAGKTQAEPEELIRYCPGCGSIGEVEAAFRDCCPDGSDARLIPRSLAEQCRATFKLAINSVATPTQSLAHLAGQSQATKAQAEPVAWAAKNAAGWDFTSENRAMTNDHINDALGTEEGRAVGPWELVPLYAAPVAKEAPAVPQGVTLKAFRGADTKQWHISIQHPFGTSWVRMSDPRDQKLAELLAAAPQAPVAMAEQQRPSDDHLWDQTIRDRDTYHEWADKLAEAIAKHFGAEIGEHSNMNCPWSEALEVIECAEPVAATKEAESVQAKPIAAAVRAAERVDVMHKGVVGVFAALKAEHLAQANVLPPTRGTGSQHNADPCDVIEFALELAENEGNQRAVDFLTAWWWETNDDFLRVHWPDFAKLELASRGRAQGGNTNTNDSGSDAAPTTSTVSAPAVQFLANVVTDAAPMLRSADRAKTADLLEMAVRDLQNAAPSSTEGAQAAPQEVRNQVLSDALESIKQMTDADDPESYRCDDREGCLDTVFAVASEALKSTSTAQANADTGSAT